MNTAFIILGNFGVGKSAIIDYPVVETEDIFLRIFDNTWIVGKTVAGADTLSALTKKQVFDIIKQHPEKHLILAGVYYSQIVDVQRLKKTHRPVVIYLDTSYENNAERIRKRGGVINVNTYLSKQQLQISTLEKVKHTAKIHIVDNNRPLKTVKAEVKEILQHETT